ncbi:MAG TPA: Stp1/IreP family PP2C-type Ser/Thr phosphatase [Rhodocyclaceae bacterium]|nr:Stp1/IreP family PP2C-type Ser/Thr phosphatase [Rhodocyclaceae bacterium]
MALNEVLEFVAQTHAGMVRTNNEDSVATDPAYGLAILADGMGGYNAGEVASGMATTLLSSELAKSFALRPPSEKDDSGKLWVHSVLETEAARTNGAIFQAAQSQPQYAGMGTTLVMGVFHDNTVTVAHIGDSRLYRLRGEDFVQVTRDHSLLQEQIDSGMITQEQAKHSQNKNLVTRAVGVDPEVSVEIHDYEVLPGDVYLFCSDGLNDMVEDEEIAMTVGALSANLELCAAQLIQMACDNGGRDNVSVILVKAKAEFPATNKWISRFLAWFN